MLPTGLFARLGAAAVGFGVGTVASYKFIFDEVKSSTATILAANAHLAARVDALEKAAKKRRPRCRPGATGLL
ncbi:hypothetical protein M885DRAFT_561336 [Pelagophyceae sp. CCMP2097]|nr:hypothetical protein M885DRAFT_561336 [Pelagophyceae sp. CCMP2097]